MDVEQPEESFQQQALEIRKPGDDFDPKTVPQNGEEFLMHMLYERKLCPAVVAKPVPRKKDEEPITTIRKLVPGDTDYDDDDDDETQTGINIFPTTEWKELQFQNFALTRSKIMTMRENLIALNPNNTPTLPTNQDNEMIWLEFCRQNEPKLSITLRLGQRMLEQLLVMLAEWLNDENLPDLATASSSTIAAAGNKCDLNTTEQWLGSWLYAVLSCLQTPLEPDVHSTLRDIARSCIKMRGNFTAEECEKKVIPYNLFIWLIAKYFGQLDFMTFI